MKELRSVQIVDIQVTIFDFDIEDKESISVLSI
jgi:hypothetical protein